MYITTSNSYYGVIVSCIGKTVDWGVVPMLRFVYTFLKSCAIIFSYNATAIANAKPALAAPTGTAGVDASK